MEKLPPEDKQALGDLEKALANEMKVLQQTSFGIAQEMKYVYKDKEGFMRFKTLKTDDKLGKLIIKLAKRERKCIKLEEGEQAGLEKLFHDKEGKKLSHKDFVAQVSSLGAKEIKNLKEELKEIKELMHDVNIIHIHLLKKVYEESTKELEDLQKQGFPSKVLGKISERRQSLAAIMKHNMLNLFKMSRYVSKEAARAT